MTKNWTDEEMFDVLKLKDQGVTNNEIGRKYNVTASAIRTIISKCNRGVS
jgi:DNA-binding NarL/FixJ family response regulator